MSHRLLEGSRCCNLFLPPPVDTKTPSQVPGEHSRLSLLAAIRAGFALPNVSELLWRQEITAGALQVPLAWNCSKVSQGIYWTKRWHRKFQLKQCEFGKAQNNWRLSHKEISIWHLKIKTRDIITCSFHTPCQAEMKHFFIKNQIIVQRLYSASFCGAFFSDRMYSCWEISSWKYRRHFCLLYFLLLYSCIQLLYSFTLMPSTGNTLFKGCSLNFNP